MQVPGDRWRSRGPLAPKPRVLPASADSEATIAAPEDCTDCVRLSAFVARAVRLLRGRPTAVVVDLGGVRRMNCALLASIVFLARECRRADTRFRLANTGPLFEAWASTHGLMSHMRRHMADEAAGHIEAMRPRVTG